MAYLDLHATFQPATPASRADVPAPQPASFSPLEWNVIALARRDGLTSLSEPSRLARALGGLFGRGTDARLADPRLETLRRLAVHAWHRGYALPVSELKAFVAAGFSMDQAETLLASVTGVRAGMRAAV
ncbi:MAG: hypothetical protein JOY99_10835 [Sphingomonadaceae bacterium]|nr:hypothetical protein [Sphingomonadaceae bacterium]